MLNQEKTHTQKKFCVLEVLSFAFPYSCFFLQISLNISICLCIFCMTAVLSNVLLWDFLQKIGVWSAQFDHSVQAQNLTTVQENKHPLTKYLIFTLSLNFVPNLSWKFGKLSRVLKGSGSSRSGTYPTFLIQSYLGSPFWQQSCIMLHNEVYDLTL